MKKVFAVLAISALVAFTSCKKAEDTTTTGTDSVKTTVTEAPAAADTAVVKDTVAAPAAADTTVKH